MSWFFSVWDCNGIGALNNKLQERAQATYKSDSLFVALGGSTSTHHFEFNDKTEEGWLVCGVGILNAETETRIMSLRDWKTLLSNDIQNFDEIDGYSIISRSQISRRNCTCFADWSSKIN